MCPRNVEAGLRGAHPHVAEFIVRTQPRRPVRRIRLFLGQTGDRQFVVGADNQCQEL